MKKTAREWAEILGINLNKFKRWARIFKGIDPHAGLSSGVARMLSESEAFEVLLGGFLVSRGMNFQEASVAVGDLGQFFIKNHYWPGHKSEGIRANSKYCQVLIFPFSNQTEPGFEYRIKFSLTGQMHKDFNGTEALQETFIEDVIFTKMSEPIQSEHKVNHFDVKTVWISNLIDLFSLSLKGEFNFSKTIG